MQINFGDVDWEVHGVYAWDRDADGHIVKIGHRSANISVDVPSDANFDNKMAQAIFASFIVRIITCSCSGP